MKRALIYASVAAQIHHFNMNNIRLLQKLGYQVDVACNMDSNGTISSEKIDALRNQLSAMGVQIYHIPLTRKITELPALISSVRKSREIISKNNYSLIHCHSPIGSVVCRIANRFSAGYKERKVIYTAHGFHFYKGAPMVNWLIYYPVEKLCSHFTSLLITINQEDYLLAKKKMKAGDVQYIPGVGIDYANFVNSDRDLSVLRDELALPKTAFVLLSVGELNSNKNHEVIIRALEYLPDDIHYVIAGKGDLNEYLIDVSKKHNVENRVHLLGFRSDIADLLKMSDLFVFPSFREGLPVSVMEAMASGKAVVASKIRGNTDLVDENKGGFLVNADNVDEYVSSIVCLYHDKETKRQMELYNSQKALRYDFEKINLQMTEIYTDIVQC